MSHVEGTTFGRLEGGELDRLGKDVVAMREKLIVKEVSGCASRDAQRVNISPAKCFSLYDFNAHAVQTFFHDVILPLVGRGPTSPIVIG